MSARVVVLSVWVLSGCGILGPQAGAPTQRGPILVLEIANTSNRDVAIEHEYAAGSAAGGGMTSARPCTHEVTPLGEMLGTYRVSIAGQVVIEGTVGDRMAGGYLIHRVAIDGDGAVELNGEPIWTETRPDFSSRAMADCA